MQVRRGRKSFRNPVREGLPTTHPERRVACRSRFLDNGSGSSSMLAETDCHRKYRNTSLWVRFQDSGVIRANACANAPRIAYAHFFSKWVAEVIDPVMGSSELGRIERQILTIEATNVCVMNLLLVVC